MCDTLEWKWAYDDLYMLSAAHEEKALDSMDFARYLWSFYRLGSSLAAMLTAPSICEDMNKIIGQVWIIKLSSYINQTLQIWI